MDLVIKKMPVGPFASNSYILTCPTNNESVIVDAGDEPERIAQAVNGTNVKFIIITHSHYDHIHCLPQLKQLIDVPVYCHQMDADAVPTHVDKFLNDGDTLNFGQYTIKILHTPGHTKGSVCLLIETHLIAGDTLFPGGPGKTRSPDAFREIIKSIEEKLYSLPDDTIIYSGHGENTTIGESKKEYQVFCSKPRKADICGDVLWLTS
ncbi:MAG: MBL fold metallo-hydrolase [Thermodesulfobacteriota bacterium]|nr:MBL fold metallo-hydrolase [Thermodesulfobacteriota bacterium]